MSGYFDGVQWKQVGILVVLFLVINLLWDTSVIFPIKLLVVFLHESSHGLTAYLTGGKVEHLEVSPAEGGVCWTVGGNRFLILSAGYLGSLLWGGLILNLASRTRYDRHVSIALGALTLCISLAYVRPFFSFGQIFTLIAGGLLFGAGCNLPEMINDLLLRIIGLTSCLYVTLDIKSDIIDRSGIQSDARMLSDLTGVPTLVYGFIWMAVAIVAAVYMVVEAAKPQMQTGDPNVYLPTPIFETPDFCWQAATPFEQVEEGKAGREASAGPEYAKLSDKTDDRGREGRKETEDKRGREGGRGRGGRGWGRGRGGRGRGTS